MHIIPYSHKVSYRYNLKSRQQFTHRDRFPDRIRIPIVICHPHLPPRLRCLVLHGLVLIGAIRHWGRFLDDPPKEVAFDTDVFQWILGGRVFLGVSICGLAGWSIILANCRRVQCFVLLAHDFFAVFLV